MYYFVVSQSNFFRIVSTFLIPGHPSAHVDALWGVWAGREPRLWVDGVCCLANGKQRPARSLPFNSWEMHVIKRKNNNTCPSYQSVCWRSCHTLDLVELVFLFWASLTVLSWSSCSGLVLLCVLNQFLCYCSEIGWFKSGFFNRGSAAPWWSAAALQGVRDTSLCWSVLHSF